MRTIDRAVCSLPLVCMLAGCGGGGGGTTTALAAQPPPPQPSTPLPDLRIADPMQMTSSSMVHLMFQVMNAGTRDASQVVVTVVRDDGKQVAGTTIASLSAGASASEAAMDDATGAGHTYIVTVDPVNTVVESIETNNATTITSVSGGTGTPIAGDLRFQDAHYHGAVFYRDPQFHFWIENTTSATVADVQYTIRQDGIDLAGFPKTVASIAAGGKKEIYESPFTGVPFADQPSGRHSYTVVIDPAGAYDESDESDNSNRSEVVLPATYAYWPMDASSKVDLRFQDPHYHGPQSGQIIVFHGWFTNAHPNRTLAGPFHFVVRRDGAPVALPAPQPGRNLGYEIDTDGSGVVKEDIAPGQIVEYVIHVQEAQATGDIPYTIDIDTRGEIDEQFESGSMDSWVNSNHVNFIVVMDPHGTSG
jgi:hypothetical protein